MGEFTPPLITNSGGVSGSGASALTVFYQIGNGANNILISNCFFLHAYWAIALAGATNCMICSNDFVAWDANCFFDGQMSSIPPTPNTVPSTDNNVTIFGAAYNLNIMDNTYNGNSTYVGTNISTTNNVYSGPDGFIWMQIGGNIFIQRNIISNYVFEGIQLSAGPNAMAGNLESSLIMVKGACGLCADNGGFAGLTSTNSTNYSTTFVGNSVYGGQSGQHGDSVAGRTYSLNFSGNSMCLFSPLDGSGPEPSFGVSMGNCQTVAVCGNTLLRGNYGVLFDVNTTNALILNNDFSGTTYAGIGYDDPAASVVTGQVFGNTIGEGATFHLQLPPGQGFSWFLQNNKYLKGTNSVPLFTDPDAAPVHIPNY